MVARFWQVCCVTLLLGAVLLQTSTESRCVGGEVGGEVESTSMKPNILWITSEDNGPELGCYGDDYADTPNIDALAQRGVRFNRCWSNAPVCAPARTTIITGLWPTSTGAMHMRSHVALPKGFLLLPQYMRHHGYYCSNNEKEDYNVATEGQVWDDSSRKAHWRNRAPVQPFFSVFNITVSHESQIRTRPHKPIHDPAQVQLPRYHPDLPEIRQDWAQYYDKLTEMDRRVGQILAELEADGLREETIVFYFGDHGSGMPRSKRWLYESGLRVPMIVAVPDKFKHAMNRPVDAGTESDDLISFIDLAPTVLSLAGAVVPNHLQGKAFLGSQATDANRYLYGLRDRMDERYDCSRAVRNERYLYIRNFYPYRAQGQYLDYMFQTPTTRAWFEAFRTGQTTPEQSSFWTMKQPEELYDLDQDPEQVRNLIDDVRYREPAEDLRGELERWMIESCDLGLMPEGVMHQRCANRSPWEVGHDAKTYPIAEVYRAANRASRSAPEVNDAERASDRADDLLVRYWQAVGLLNRMANKQSIDLEDVRRRLSTEESVCVRIVLAETLGRSEVEADRRLALDQLVKMSDARMTSLWDAMAAMNALAHLSCTADEVQGRIASIRTDVVFPHQRYSPYLDRLKQDLQEQLLGQGE